MIRAKFVGPGRRHINGITERRKQESQRPYPSLGILIPLQLAPKVSSYHRNLHLLTRISADIEVAIQQGNLQQLMKAIDAGTPPAVFILTGELPYWQENVYHAVVLTGYTEVEFSIHDPAFAFAPQIVSMGNLDLAWLENDSYFAVVQRRR